MAAEDTQLILSAMKERDQRSDKILGDVLAEIRGMSAALVKGFAQDRIPAPAPAPSAPNGKNLIFAMAAIVFGLMAPMYIMLKGVNDDISAHNQLDAHPAARERIAATHEQLKEVETQFRGVREVMSIQHENRKEDIAEIRSWFGTPPLKIEQGK